MGGIMGNIKLAFVLLFLFIIPVTAQVMYNDPTLPSIGKIKGDFVRRDGSTPLTNGEWFVGGQLSGVEGIIPAGYGDHSLGSPTNFWNNLYAFTYENSTGGQFEFDTVCTSTNGLCGNGTVTTTGTYNETYNNLLNQQNSTANQCIIGILSNGTAVYSPCPTADLTNVARTNNSEIITGNWTFNYSVTITQGSGLFMTPRINIGNITSNAVNGTRAIGIGGRSTTRGLRASGQDVVVIGNGALGNVSSCVSIGVNAVCTGTNGVSLRGTASGNSALSMGNNAVASGTQSVSMGTNTDSSGTNCLALGGGAIGTGAKCRGFGSISIGTNSGAGYKLDGFTSEDYTNTASNTLLGSSSFIWNTTSATILGRGNIIQSFAQDSVIVGTGNTITENVTAIIIGNDLTNSQNNSILMAAGIINLQGNVNVTGNISSSQLYFSQNKQGKSTSFFINMSNGTMCSMNFTGGILTTDSTC